MTTLLSILFPLAFALTVFDTSKGEAPYGVIINVQTKEEQFYSESGEVYSNKIDILLLQDALAEQDALNKII